MAGVEITESLLDSFINFVRKDNAGIVSQIFNCKLLKTYSLGEGYEVMMLKRIISKVRLFAFAYGVVKISKNFEAPTA
jgi:hypothetical protein